MSDFDNYFTNQSKQERSQARVEKILDAVERLSLETPNKKIEIRAISKKALISVGAIYHHFPSLHSIFASLLVRKVQGRLKEITALISNLSPEVTLQQITDLWIDQAFNEWGNKPMVAKEEALRFFYQNAHRPEVFYSFAQALYPFIQEFIQRNTTNTIREISEEEWPLLNRLVQTAIISPFIEQLPIAGTKAHRKIVKDVFVRLYTK